MKLDDLKKKAEEAQKAYQEALQATRNEAVEQLKELNSQYNFTVEELKQAGFELPEQATRARKTDRADKAVATKKPDSEQLYKFGDFYTSLGKGRVNEVVYKYLREGKQLYQAINLQNTTKEDADKTQARILESKAYQNWLAAQK